MSPAESGPPGDGDLVRQVCLVRYHDGTAKPNWGGRATSLALGRLVTAGPRHLAAVVNGDVIARGYGEAPGRSAGRRVVDAARHRLGRPQAESRPPDLSGNVPAYGRVPELAAELTGPLAAVGGTAASVRDALAVADEVWVNGEGDLILAPRRTLLRTLVLMRAASDMGRPVRLLNSILSRPPVADPHPVVLDALAPALAACSSVSYRDPASLRLHQELFPEIPATWAPDALFLWVEEGCALAALPADRRRFGPLAEGLDPVIQQWVTAGEPYVALSGSSSVRSRGEDVAAAARGLRHLIRGLADAGWPSVVVPTCSGDEWMEEVAKEVGVPSTTARLPLAAGMVVLAGAACFTSGRYHPSILAADVGTPVVLMASNSHKTQSLYEVLGEDGRTELPFLADRESIDRVVADTVAVAVDAEERRTERLARARDLAAAVGRSVGDAVAGPPW